MSIVIDFRSIFDYFKYKILLLSKVDLQLIFEAEVLIFFIFSFVVSTVKLKWYVNKSPTVSQCLKRVLKYALLRV